MKKEVRTLILTGGSLDILFAKTYISNQIFDEIIAVDNGLLYADLLQLVPTYIVGDFDTVSKDLLQTYEMNPFVKVRRYRPQKDETDTQIALELAIEKKSTEVVLLGAMGNRFDHTLANVERLFYLLRYGIPAYIIDATNKIYVINEPYTIRKEEAYGNYISLIPYTKEVTGVTLTGFKYPLRNHCMKKGESLGISNEIVDDFAKIDIKRGVLYVVEANDESQYL